MLTQEQINKDWTVRSDNYNNYVEEEFATNRPEKWLELIESQAPAERPLRILDAGCGPGFFSVLLSKAGHHVTGIDGSEGMLAYAKKTWLIMAFHRNFCRGILARCHFRMELLTWWSAGM